MVCAVMFLIHNAYGLMAGRDLWSAIEGNYRGQTVTN